MIEEKQLWKIAYLWVRYFKYKCIHYDPERKEVWLSHTQTGHINIFKYGSFTTQELEFDKSRIIEHHEELQNHLSFKVLKYDIYIITDKPFDPVTFNTMNPVKVRFHSIHSKKDLHQITHHPIVKYWIANNDKKSIKHYQRRVLNQNKIEQSMYQFTPVTYSLITINILIWLFILLFTPHRTDIEIINLGALSHFNVVHGEWYRLITSMFLHLDFEHLIFNMFSLYIFGKIVEANIGYWQMLVVYFFSGIFGNIVSLALLPSGFSVGASGAIFGLLGAIFALMVISQRFTRKALLQSIAAILIMAVITLLVRNVNIVAHLAGVMGGFLILYLGYLKSKHKRHFFLVLGITILVTLGLIIKIYLTQSTNIYNQIIQNEMHQGHYREARNMVSDTLKHHYDDDETYFLSGMIIATQDSKAEAMNEWEKGLRVFPNSSVLNYHMALANRSLADTKSAKKHINKALKVEPNNKNYKNLKKELDDASAN
ncbi:rhomboid family intramembrane serine protease [Staphylococcus felis]|uniref:rhomboid family intramembrane serine protease n=1 Tax=Staphylococcus felis TaxID=46127 RepID=UPI003F42B3A8